MTQGTQPLPPQTPEPLTRAQRRAAGTRRAVIILAVTVGVLAVVAAAWGAWYYNDLSGRLAADERTAREAASVLETEPVVAPQIPKPLYILLLGSDARPGQKHARSDSIVIARLDEESGSVALLSIPRDTRVKVPGHGTTRITNANAFGGPALAITTVKQYTGLPIDHYVELNFAGFARVVDALGGVTVVVDKAINDKHGANTGGVSNVTRIPAGPQTLKGDAALTYVRARHITGGDFGRIAHQQVFLKALASQALSLEKLPRLPAVIGAAADNIETDMSVATILGLANEWAGFDGGSMTSYSAPGTTGTIGGASYVLPDVAKSQALFRAFQAGTPPAQ